MNEIIFAFKEHKEFKKGKPWSAVPMSLDVDNFTTPPHYAETIEINIYTNATGDVYIGGQHFELKGNSVFFVAPNIVHSMKYGRTSGTATTLKINPVLLKPILDIDGLLRCYNKSYYDLPVNLPYSDEIDKIKEAFMSDDINDACVAILHLFKNLITNAETSSAGQSVSSSDDNELRSIITWTENNFTNKITLDEVADIFGYSKHYFCKKFKKLTGITYLTYLNNVRVHNACHLLKSGKSISDTCDLCGFDDIPYFTQLFKKITGITPKKYVSRRTSA